VRDTVKDSEASRLMDCDQGHVAHKKAVVIVTEIYVFTTVCSSYRCLCLWSLWHWLAVDCCYCYCHCGNVAQWHSCCNCNSNNSSASKCNFMSIFDAAVRKFQLVNNSFWAIKSAKRQKIQRFHFVYISINKLMNIGVKC